MYFAGLLLCRGKTLEGGHFRDGESGKTEGNVARKLTKSLAPKLTPDDTRCCIFPCPYISALPKLRVASNTVSGGYEPLALG